MPHATNDNLSQIDKMGQNLVNGDKHSSQFIDHLTSYPVVSDGIETFKSNPYGKKSLELADNAYNRFGKPVESYLETPKQYAAPYAKKADELASSGLTHVENTFPIVKEDTTTIVDKGKAFVWWPYNTAGEGVNYVFATYNDEYQKTSKHNNRGDGIFTLVLAILSTELKIASDFFQAIADFLGPKYEESKQKGSEYVQYAAQTADQYKEFGKEKLEEAKNIGQQKGQEAKNQLPNDKEEAKNQAYQTKEEAKNQAQQTKEQAYQTKEEAKSQAQQTKEDAKTKAQKS